MKVCTCFLLFRIFAYTNSISRIRAKGDRRGVRLTPETAQEYSDEEYSGDTNNLDNVSFQKRGTTVSNRNSDSNSNSIKNSQERHKEYNTQRYMTLYPEAISYKAKTTKKTEIIPLSATVITRRSKVKNQTTTTSTTRERDVSSDRTEKMIRMLRANQDTDDTKLDNSNSSHDIESDLTLESKHRTQPRAKQNDYNPRNHGKADKSRSNKKHKNAQIITQYDAVIDVQLANTELFKSLGMFDTVELDTKYDTTLYLRSAVKTKSVSTRNTIRPQAMRTQAEIKPQKPIAPTKPPSRYLKSYESFYRKQFDESKRSIVPNESHSIKTYKKDKKQKQNYKARRSYNDTIEVKDFNKYVIKRIKAMEKELNALKQMNNFSFRSRINDNNTDGVEISNVTDKYEVKYIDGSKRNDMKGNVIERLLNENHDLNHKENNDRHTTSSHILSTESTSTYTTSSKSIVIKKDAVNATVIDNKNTSQVANNNVNVTNNTKEINKEVATNSATSTLTSVANTTKLESVVTTPTVAITRSTMAYSEPSYYDYPVPPNAKFDESLLMKQHHQNFLQIKDFIKKAQHKFHEERSVLRVGDYELESTRDDEFLDHSITNWWWDNTSSIEQLGRNTPQNFPFPLTRSQPSFPFSITPYTTELNNRHLKWEEIFPDQNIYTRSSASRLRTGRQVSFTPKNPSLPQPPSKMLIPRQKDQKSSGPTIKPSKLHKCTRPLHPKTSLLHNTSIRSHSSQPFGPTTTSITPNEELKKIWLREITTYTPVERWFKTLATQTRLTPSNDYTTNPAFQFGRTLWKAQALVPSKQLKNDSKDQPPLILRQGIPLSETPTEVDDYVFLTASTALAKTAQFFIKGLEGILRTDTEKDEQRTKMTDEKSAKLVSDVEMKVTPTTAGDVLLIELEQETAAPTSRKSRRFHSKARMKNCHHNSHKRQKTRERHQINKYRHPEYSNEDIYRKQQGEVENRMLRRTIERQRRFSMNTPKQRFKKNKKLTRPKENKKHSEPTETSNAMLQYYERDDTEDEKFIKFIERTDESVRKTAQKDETSLYHHIKESLKQAESKKRAIRQKVKAELLRKIVEGSSYSDEEASLTKNLMQALQYGNRTFEHDVARNN